MSILLRRFHNSGSVIETVVEYTAPERVVVKNNISGDGIDLYDDSKSTYDYDTQLVYNGKLKVLAELDNTKLTSITIPECVEVVYAKCFDKCSQLRTVNFLHKKDGGNISFDLSIDYFSFAFSNITDIYINGVFSQDWINSIGNGFLQGVPKCYLKTVNYWVVHMIAL